jgi:outer membrane protein
MKLLRLILPILILVGNAAAKSSTNLTLEECRQLALENNEACSISELEVSAAEHIKDSAFSRYFPKVKANIAMWSAEEGLLELSTPIGSLNGLKEGSLASVTAVQPLYAGGRIHNGNCLAELSADVQKDKRDLVRDEVLLRAEELYWLVVSVDEKIRTINSYDTLLEQLHVQVSDGVEAGLALRNDLLKVDLAQAEVRFNHLQLVNAKSLALMALCQHVGVEYEESIVLSEPPLIDDSPQDYHVEAQMALESRSEYALLLKSVESEQLQTSLKRGEFLPQIGIGASLISFEMDEESRRNFGTVFGQVSIPISGWWGGSYELKERKAKERIARENFKQSSELLTLQIEKAWRDLVDAHEEVKLSRLAEEQANENLILNQDSYAAGLIQLSDLLGALAMRQKTRNQSSDSRAQYLFKRTFYLQVSGNSRVTS